MREGWCVKMVESKSYAPVKNRSLPYIRTAYPSQLSLPDANLAKISRYLTQAIFLEVCTHPKPGLVTRASNGAHEDMSILTFAMSSAVLAEAFSHLQAMGAQHRQSLPELFVKVREYGRKIEEELLAVTKGINTQRGILFLGGIVSAAAGYAWQQGENVNSLPQLVAAMTKGLVARELEFLERPAVTYGEQLYYKYGITGIRGEVEAGLPSVIKVGLPALQEAFAKQADLNTALVHTLLALMSVVEDSNVLWRTDIDTGTQVKLLSADILKQGSVFTQRGRAKIENLQKKFELQRISPGGSADLLSVTIALYLLEHKEFPVKIL